MFIYNKFGDMLKKLSEKYILSSDGHLIKTRDNSIVRGSRDNGGYVHVSWLDAENKTRSSTMHRLVALHFIENSNAYPQVHHKDHNKENNSVDNLEWVTRSQNMKMRRPWTRKEHRFSDAETQTI